MIEIAGHPVTFSQPARLWLLALAGALAVGYVVVQVRRRSLARRYATSAMLPSLLPRRIGPWRHLVAVVFLAAVVVSALGAAQPTVPGEQEREQATIIVAIDVSDSMGATDVAPDRITAAKAAATDFVRDLPDTFDVGVVTAGASPIVAVPPTTDHDRVVAAIARLELSPGTALGDAIFTALGAIPPVPPGNESAVDERAARIVLLSDGVTTTGRPDSEAIDAAVEAGVPVSTIAFGTDEATVVSQGQVVSVPVDATALQAIADGTEGAFFEAESLQELRSIYETVDAEIAIETVDRDIAEYFAAAALALLLVGLVAAITTTGRVAWA